MHDLYHKGYKKLCADLQDNGILRNLQALSYNRNMLDFSTNDYLQLSKNPNLINAAIDAAEKYGVGATGSRLLSGNKDIFQEFEKQIAHNKNSQKALIFNSGFQANISTLSCLLNPAALAAKPVVIFDKLNHSSLYQAAFLSGAKLMRFRHNDTQHLTEIFSKIPKNQPKFLVTETVFGMDGDILPHKIIEIAKQNNAFIYLDEAHATGVMGDDGYGLANHFDLQDHPHLVMGTFSKALGGSGAYIACDSIIKQYLINKAAGFIYTTASSPITVAAAFAAWKIIPSLAEQRKNLQHLANYCRESLKNSGFNVGNSESHIIPIIVGDNNAVIAAKQQLVKKYDIITCAILPPTVPYKTARLRIALNVQHTKADIDQLVTALRAIL